MKYKSFIFCCLVFFYKVLPAQVAHNFTPIDSILIQFEAENHLYFNHKVTKNQTIYSISNLYRINTKNLLELNPEFLNSPLKESSVLKIPFSADRLIYQPTFLDKSHIAVFYKIAPKENLFSICKRKLNLNINNIAIINKLNSQQVKTGQNLFLGYLQLQLILDKEINLKEIHEKNTEHFTRHSRGVGICELNGLGTGRYFALHNKAEIESYIEIINPILDIKVLAKVIGRIPPIYEKDVQVIVSAEVARQLNVFNKRFFIYLNYK